MGDEVGVSMASASILGLKLARVLMAIHLLKTHWSLIMLVLLLGIDCLCMLDSFSSFMLSHIKSAINNAAQETTKLG